MALDKATPSESDGFLSRWSQRKQALRKGVVLAEPEQPKLAQALDQNQPLPIVNTAQSATDLGAIKPQEEVVVQPPAPTMQDVQGLTPQSDYKPFMRGDVAPEVKNAAMKQLFKDPHFNVMDMMDIYVDDYSKPDPLPPEMLRKMAVTQFLGFWKEEEEAAEKAAAEKKAREDAECRARENVAQSDPENTATETTQESPAAAQAAIAKPHDHPDLQLQPDDAARRESALRRPG